MKGNNGSSEINQSSQYYSQLGKQSGELFDQWQKDFLPQIESIFPELSGAVTGSNSTLATADAAPVKAETAQNINNVGGQFGGVGNPNALVDDIALSGQQNAGLAGVNAVNQGISGVESLAGIGASNASTGISGLGSAAGGDASLGENLQEQSNEWWQQILQSGGTAAGYALNPASAATRSTPVSGSQFATNANDTTP